MKAFLRVVLVGLAALALQVGLALAAVDTSDWKRVELSNHAKVAFLLPSDFKMTLSEPLGTDGWVYQFEDFQGRGMMIRLRLNRLPASSQPYLFDVLNDEDRADILKIIQKDESEQTEGLQYVKMENGHSVIVGWAKSMAGYQLITVVSPYYMDLRVSANRPEDRGILLKILEHFEF